MVTLIAAPALYLAVPLLLPLDLIPAGLTRSVLPKVTTSEGRGFVRRLLTELEGAVDRAADAAEAGPPAAAGDQAGPPPAAGRAEPQPADRPPDSPPAATA
jgi:hypothetical protein